MGLEFEYISDASIPEITIEDLIKLGGEDGNIVLLTNSPYPIVAWRMGATTKAQVIGFLDAGNLVADITSNLILRNIDNSGEIVSINIGGDIQLPNATTAPASPASGRVKIFAQFGEAKVMDDSGNVTTFSPHNTEGIDIDHDDNFPVTIHHKNSFNGIEQWIYLSKMARIIEGLTGEKIIYEEHFEMVDWDENENRQAENRQAEIIDYDLRRQMLESLPGEKRDAAIRALGVRPKPYNKRTKPEWIKPPK